TLRMPDADRGLDRDPRFAPAMPLSSTLHRMAWQCGVLRRELLDAAGRHPDWIVRSHEELIADPLAQVPALARAVGLEWSARCDELLRASNKVGVGHHTTRE